MKNYDLLEKEIDIIISYTENNLLFKSLQNAIKQDLFRFLDEIDNSFAEHLDLSFSSESILHSMDLQIKINKKFQRDENKIIQNTFDILISLLKDSLTANLKGSKGKTKISTHQIKFTGYLKYFEIEIEKNDTDQLDSYFAFYTTFYENVSKITEIINKKNMLSFYEIVINEKFIEILSYLLQNISTDMEGLKNAPIRRLKSFISNFAPLYTNFSTIFANFEFKAIQNKFNDPIKLLFKYAIEICSKFSFLQDNSLKSLDTIEFLEALTLQLAEFLELIIIPLNTSKSSSIYDFLDKLFENFSKRISKLFSSLEKNQKMEVS